MVIASTLSEALPNSTLPARPATAESVRNMLNNVNGMPRIWVKYNVDNAKKMPRPTELISVARAYRPSSAFPLKTVQIAISSAPSP